MTDLLPAYALHLQSAAWSTSEDLPLNISLARDAAEHPHLVSDPRSLNFSVLSSELSTFRQGAGDFCV